MINFTYSSISMYLSFICEFINIVFRGNSTNRPSCFETAKHSPCSSIIDKPAASYSETETPTARYFENEKIPGPSIQNWESLSDVFTNWEPRGDLVCKWENRSRLLPNREFSRLLVIRDHLLTITKTCRPQNYPLRQNCRFHRIKFAFP